MQQGDAWADGSGQPAGRLAVLIESEAAGQLAVLSALYHVPAAILVALALRMVLADAELVLDLIDSATTWLT